MNALKAAGFALALALTVSLLPNTSTSPVQAAEHNAPRAPLDGWSGDAEDAEAWDEFEADFDTLQDRSPELIAPEATSYILGPSGGKSGTAKSCPSSAISKITVKYGSWIDSVTINDACRIGGTGGGTMKEIQLSSGEYVIKVWGTYESYVNSVNIRTNLKTWGPYGKTSGAAYEYNVASGKFAGFYGRQGTYLDAIGILSY